MTKTRKIKTIVILGLILFACVVGVKLLGSQNRSTERADVGAVVPKVSDQSIKTSEPTKNPQSVYRKNDLEMPASEIWNSVEAETANQNEKQYPIQLVTAIESVQWDSETEAPPKLHSYQQQTETKQIQSSIIDTPVSLATMQQIVELEPHLPKPKLVGNPLVPKVPASQTGDQPSEFNSNSRSMQRYPLVDTTHSASEEKLPSNNPTGNSNFSLQLNDGQLNKPESTVDPPNELQPGKRSTTPIQLDASDSIANQTKQKPSDSTDIDVVTANAIPETSVKSILALDQLESETEAVQLQAHSPFQLPEFEKNSHDQFRVATASNKVSTNFPSSTAPAKPDNTPSALQGAENYVLAAQPQKGDHWKDDRPIVDNRAMLMPPSKHGFSPDPIDPALPYDPYQQMQVYEGKTLNANQRPLLELGRPWYQLGQLSPGSPIFGKHNNVTPQFLVYGDFRSAIASNTQNGDNVSQVAYEANLDFDLKLTGTERFHMFMSPLDSGGKNTRRLLDADRFVGEFDADVDFGYFEGDLGAIVGGFTNQTLPFDLPFAVGVMPLLLQNGVWMEDAFLGVAATIPARNSPRFNISNMDITFFAGYDKIDSPAFAGDDSAARMYGMASFIEAMNGYFEIDYAFFDDRTFDDRSYHNFGLGFTRRFGRLLSNSTRVIVNAGQNSSIVENTADGVLLLSENSLITSSPSTLVPYANFFVGFDRPQSAARAAAAGGILRNTGILFESDGMTGYPTLDPTANDTFGGALGVNLIADDFSQQLVVELAALGVMNEDSNRVAPGPQYGVGFRYQLPLTNAMILRADGMMGFLEDQQDIRGLRFELRHKY